MRSQLATRSNSTRGDGQKLMGIIADVEPGENRFSPSG